MMSAFVHSKAAERSDFKLSNELTFPESPIHFIIIDHCAAMGLEPTFSMMWTCP